jgi:glucokinase
MGRFAVGIDIGRTNIRAGLVNDKGEVLRSIKERTDAAGGFLRVEEQVAAAFGRMAQGREVAGVGVGIAGQCDAVRGVVRCGPNLFWPDVPFRDRLADALGVPVTLRNDVVMATVGEWRHGAGLGCNDVVALFVGTGIGGGAIVNGRLLEGRSGCGGHFGHVSVQLDGPLCGCGRPGCVEAYASGCGLAARALNDEGLSSSSLSGAAKLDGAAVARAVAEGDELAIRLRDDAAAALTSALASIINCLEPEIAILGGAVMDGLPGLYERCAAEAVEKCLPSHRDHLAVTRSVLGDMAGVIGSASMALEPL